MQKFYLPKFAIILAAALGLSACAETSLVSTPENKSVIDSTVRRAAVEAEQNTNYLAAVSHYQKLWAQDRENFDLFFGVVRNLRYVGSSKDAIRLLTQNEETFGDDPRFHLEFGKTLVAADKSRDAITRLSKTIELKTDNWQTYSTLGIAFDRLQLHRNALDAYELALELSPDNPAILNNMAISAALAGDIKRAIETINRAARLDRDNVQIRQNLALFLGIKGDVQDAEALARMDLDEEAVRNNLSIFRSFSRPPK